MTQSKRLLILLYISILFQETPCEFDDIGDSGHTLEKAESFFDYSLCKLGGTGLKWACMTRDGSTGVLENNRNTKTIEEAVALLAIQPSTVARWRIVMQIHGAVKLGEGVALGYDNHKVFDCKQHADQISAKTRVSDVFPFTISSERKKGAGLYNDTMLMCEFTIESISTESNPNLREELKTAGKSIYLLWHSSEKKETAMIGPYGISDVIQKIGASCVLDLIYTEPNPPPGNEIYRKFNTDRRQITCPAGFTMRIKEDGPPGRKHNDNYEHFQTADRMRCDGTSLKVLTGPNEQTRTQQMQMHCARKNCKMCKVHSDTCKAGLTGDQCPTLEPADGYETCNQLKCTKNQFKFIVDYKPHKGNPVCENSTWWFGDVEVKNAECGDKVKCVPADSAISVKRDMADFNLTKIEDIKFMKSNLIFCKQGKGNMSYESQKGGEVKLRGLFCNLTDGKWYEQNPTGPNQPYHQDHKLECKFETGASEANKAGALWIAMGATAGVAVLIGVIIVIAWCCCGKRRKRQAEVNAVKHKLATKSTKSRESKSKSNVGSGSGSGGKKNHGGHDTSAPPSFTQKNRDEDNDGSKPRIPKPDERAEAEAKKKALAMLESSKIHDDADEEQAAAAVARVKQAMQAPPKKVTRAAATPDGVLKKTKKVPERAPAEDEDAQLQQQQQQQPDQSEKNGGADEAAADAQVAANNSPYQLNEIASDLDPSVKKEKKIPPAAQTPEEPEPAPETPSAPRAPIKDRPSRKMVATPENQIQDEGSIAKTPQLDEPKKDEDTNTPVVKPKDTVADMPTAKKKEESAKKKSKKEPAPLPYAPEPNEKAKKGAKRGGYVSDMESEIDKVSSRSSKKKLTGGRRDEPSRKADPTQHTHVHGSEAGCGPLCMPVPRSHTDESKDD